MDLPAYRESSLCKEVRRSLPRRLAESWPRGYSQYSRLRNAAGGRQVTNTEACV